MSRGAIPGMLRGLGIFPLKIPWINNYHIYLYVRPSRYLAVFSCLLIMQTSGHLDFGAGHFEPLFEYWEANGAPDEMSVLAVQCIVRCSFGFHERRSESNARPFSFIMHQQCPCHLCKLWQTNRHIHTSYASRESNPVPPFGMNTQIFGQKSNYAQWAKTQIKHNCNFTRGE